MFDPNVSIQLTDSTGVVYTGVAEVTAIADFGDMIMVIFAVFVFIELLEMIFYNRRV